MTTITVHRRGGRPISRDLWGVFFEDINHAADGGLYAELVQNRSFAYSEADAPDWHSLTAWRTDGAVLLRTDAPLSTTAPTYVQLDSRGGAARLTNEGHDGIVLRRHHDYRFSVFARTSQQARLEVELNGGGATAVETVPLEASGSWKRVEATLSAGADATDGTLSITVEGGARVDLDVVSLFPHDVFGAHDLDDGRQDDNGLRADLAESIAALRPRFVRFPGGCVAHGLGLDNMYRWPDSIGPVHQRRQDRNLWGYHQSRGLGYYEMFLFCSRIGATPLPVVAAGVCCQNTIGGPLPLPDEEMDAYVREVLDLVEFANGDVSTPWGSVRASLGHPAPFGLRYLGVGNEDQIDDVFRDRFGRLLTALRDDHPDIEVVGTAGPSPQGPDFDEGWSLARELGVPLVDEHSYKSPAWFFQNVHRYDTYDRSGPRVYLGEYGSWGNTMLNALAEAAFMTGLERNGDVVALASYAPLLGKIGHSQWVPDLIYFDGGDVHETLNYHVQSMFSRTAGDVSHQVDVYDAPHWVRPRAPRTRLALSTRGFSVLCTDIVVQGARLCDVEMSATEERTTLPVDLTERDFRLEFTLTVDGGDVDRGSFAVHAGDLDGDHWEWNFGTWLNRTLTLHATTDGFRDEAAPGVPYRVEVGTTHRIVVQVQEGGTVFSVFVDGSQLLQHVDRRDPEHRFVASCVTDGETGETHLRIVNATDEARDVVLRDEDGSRLAARSAETLTAPWDTGAPFGRSPARPGDLPVTPELLLPARSVTVVALHRFA